MLDKVRRSILLRLTVSAGLGISLMAAATGIYLYSSFHHAITVTVAKDLVNTAKVLLHRLHEDQLPLDKEILDVGEHLQVRLTDSRKKVLLESKGMDQLVPMAIYPIPERPWTFMDGRKELGHSLTLLSVEYRDGWIQIARNHDIEDALLRKFRASLFRVLGLIPLLAAVIGYWFMHHALGPLKQLAQRAGNIRPETLKTRLDPTEFPRELEPIALALNDTLGRLEIAFTRLGEMNSDMAHDLRTPVHSLRLEVEGMLSRGEHSLETGESLSGMIETLDHMAALIEQMLFLARAEDPATKIERATLNAEALLQGAAAPFESIAEESQVTIAIDVSGDQELTGDPILLRRALHNLLANAIRHSRPGGRVILRASAQSGNRILEVEDQGEGIPSSILTRLGQRFLRGDPSRGQQRGGAGLGLAIVQSIVRLHGGTFEIQSQEGMGTRAMITLPEAFHEIQAQST